jgi:hypothetical protein
VQGFLKSADFLQVYATSCILAPVLTISNPSKT